MKDFDDLKAPIIAVDFDGTLVTNAFPRIGEPKQEVIDMIKRMKSRGAKIILWTCRGGHYLDDALRACEELGLEFDAVNENLPEVNERMGSDSRKIVADLYVDDRAYDPDEIHIYDVENLMFGHSQFDFI